VVSQILPLEQLRTQQLWAERLANSVLSVLAAIALLLTLVGIFSVVAYSVDRRMNEFGLRAALGATRKDLAQLVLRKALALTLAGVVLGVGGALALTRFLASLLFETSAQDPWALFGVSVLILLSAGAASLLPSLRATRVDVARLLKAE
jgi:ABC-type antimicrobial peptide transport system permease subunit